MTKEPDEMKLSEYNKELGTSGQDKYTIRPSSEPAIINISHDIPEIIKPAKV